LEGFYLMGKNTKPRVASKIRKTQIFIELHLKKSLLKTTKFLIKSK